MNTMNTVNDISDLVYATNSDIDKETLDLLQRDWIIRLELDRTVLPKVCKARLIVTDRPGSGKHEVDELLLMHIVRLEPRQAIQPTIVPSIEDTSKDVELPDGNDAQATEHELEWPDIDEHDPSPGEVDENLNNTFFRDDESSHGYFSGSEDVTSHPNERFFDPDYYCPPTDNSSAEQHTFIHCKLDGFAEWSGDYVTVIVGHQEIPFDVPRFLLTRNFEFFRAVFEVGRWTEASTNQVRLREESPVDFVLLLRFLIHNTVNDFNQVVFSCYPFDSKSNPIHPNEEYGDDAAITISPWIMRVVALAERMCFDGPGSRLSDVLRGTMKVCPTDRVSPALMDWLFNNSAEESVLRAFVYERLLQSLITGDVDPSIYKPYAESDPELMSLLLIGILEHPSIAPSAGWQNLFITQCRREDGDLVRKRSRMIRDSFELAFTMFLGFHRFLHDMSPSCVKTDHVWNSEFGWFGCKGGCAGCWNKDLGGSMDEVARILLD